jgi:hypothetical protein
MPRDAGCGGDDGVVCALPELLLAGSNNATITMAPDGSFCVAASHDRTVRIVRACSMPRHV